MFLGIMMLGIVLVFFFLWGDYIKILIFLEIISLILVVVLIFFIKIDYFSINFFFFCLIFLVCESRMGFILFIFYIRIENEVVKKLNLVQF